MISCCTPPVSGRSPPPSRRAPGGRRGCTAPILCVCVSLLSCYVCLLFVYFYGKICCQYMFVRRFHRASNSSLSVNVMFMSRRPLTLSNQKCRTSRHLYYDILYNVGYINYNYNYHYKHINQYMHIYIYIYI